MRNHIVLAAMLVGLLATLTGGCKTGNVPRFVDAYFTNEVLAVQHNEIFAGAILRDQRNMKDAVAALRAYLEGRQAAPAAAVAYWPMGSERVRARDYWASVLSQLTNVPLHLSMNNSDEERDRKINEFLKRLQETENRGF